MSRLLYESGVYPLLKLLDAERSHRLALRTLRAAERAPGGLLALGRLAPAPDPRLRVSRYGLTFANPLGVAAGLDKDAEAVAALFALGFGAVETGTVTPLPQPGNPRPRVWRLPDERALINAMGFPSAGAAAVRSHLAGRAFPGVLGINLGKNRDTPAERAAEDYVSVLSVLWDVAGYVTVNVSSPNTPGLRALQGRDALAAILRAVQERNASIADLKQGNPRPVLVKIAPDLDDQGLDDVLAGALDGRADGLIIANTTTDRSVLREAHADLPGGVSGRPLRARSTEITRAVTRRLGRDRLPIIGVGGISSADDVVERMRAGASLVQIYTAFIYGGPTLPGRILRDLSAYVDREGLTTIEEIIGTDL
jgi:dihydroorotate dehydrogenase